MANDKNKHGLSRYIETNVKSTIRKNSYYGCVICGSSIYQYEHVDPEFNEAHEHDPKKMTLLCGGCHDQVTRGYWSKDKVLDAMNAPKNRQRGYAAGELDIRPEDFIVDIGSCRWINTRTILSTGKERLLFIDQPEAPGAPFRLYGRFYDTNGQILLDIVDNEYQSYVGDWDIKTEGGRDPEILITMPDGETGLTLRTYPSENRIEFTNLNMLCGSYRIRTENDVLVLERPDGNINEVSRLLGKNLDSAMHVSEGGWTFGIKDGQHLFRSQMNFLKIEGLSFGG